MCRTESRKFRNVVLRCVSYESNEWTRSPGCMYVGTHTHTLSVQLHWRGVFARPLEAQVLKSLIKYTGADTTPSASLHSCTEGLCWRFTFISLRPGSSPHPPPSYMQLHSTTRGWRRIGSCDGLRGLVFVALQHTYRIYIYSIYILRDTHSTHFPLPGPHRDVPCGWRLLINL